MPYSDKDQGEAISRATIPCILCFAHLRWNFVYQRPQHLLTRAAARTRVFYFEEPVFSDSAEPSLRITHEPGDVEVLTPMLPHGAAAPDVTATQRKLIDRFLHDHQIRDFVCWYYTPMALFFTDHLHPRAMVYDCMDQLSAFDGAPPELIEQEQRLFARASVVFTGGRSLYEEKRHAHANVHLFPSSVDFAHFAAARTPHIEPQDQQAIAYPRVGFFGVLDERLDRDLLRDIAALEPAMHFVMIGPVVKIREEDLPHAANIHYLGRKQYSELPDYLAFWNVAMLPFALNASTRFISPTKTPEYLSAGKPVVSTPVRDVEEPYGRLGFARIASDAAGFAAALREALDPPAVHWLTTVDEYLGHTSWDATFEDMWNQVLAVSQ